MSGERIVCRLTAYLLNVHLVIGSIELVGMMVTSADWVKTLGNVIRYSSLLFVFMFAIKRLITKPMRCMDFFLIFGMMLLYLIALVRLNAVLMNKAVWVPIIVHYLYVAPLFILSRQIKNFGELICALKPYSYLAAVYGVLSGFVYNIYTTDYMTFSYSLMMPAIFSLLFVLYDRSVFHGLISAVLVAVIAIKGARGPLLCFGASCLCIIPLYFKKLTTKKFFIICITTLAGICTIVFWRELITVLSERFPDSRTLYILRELNTFDGFLTGRLPQYNAGINLIKRNPLFGYGVLSDRYALCMELGYDEMVQGVYLHNIFLEFIFQYGLIIGSVILSCIIVFVFRVFKRFKLMGRAEQMLCLALFPSTLSGMQVSNSYIDNPWFWMMMGVGLTVIDRTRIRRKRML